MTTIGYFLSAEEYAPDQLIEQARLAEEAGFDALWISDHYHPWTSEQGQSPFVWSMIGALAQVCDLPVTTDFRSVLEGSGVRLTVEAPPAPVWVDGDATRLAQIVGNLLHNAHKFTNPGGSVTVRLAEDPDRRAVLSVRDTGWSIATA